MKKLTISILVPDISSNSLGAATVLAKALEPHYGVEIVGPDLGPGINPMYRDAFACRSVIAPRLYRLPNYFWDIRKISKTLSGDVVIAVKSYADTVPVALWHKYVKGKKAVVYLDEWDGANYFQRTRMDRFNRWMKHAVHPLDDVYFPWVEKLVPLADQVVCASSFLQKKFGGRIIYLGVDVDRYSPPDAAATAQLNRALGLENKYTIVFGGVVRPHKGVEYILDALHAIGDPNNRLLIVGPDTDHLRKLREVERYAPYLICAGAQPGSEMPRYLAVADMVILPQVNNLLSQSQVPCKVFEAMAMGKPIIAGAISDLPRILDGCGWIVPPGNAQALAAAVTKVKNNPEDARLKGLAAREKCARLYSARVLEEQLKEVIETLRN